MSTRLLSAFAIWAYLASALLPCEAPEGLRFSSARLHAEIDSPATQHARSRPQPHASVSEHAHDHSMHGHGHGHGHDELEGPQRHQTTAADSDDLDSTGHASAHHDSTPKNRRESRESRAARAVGASAAQLAFTAPCLCGCGDTRATVGGGASRLGAAVPGQFVADLPPSAEKSASRADPGRFVFQVLEIDPIPI